MSNLVIPRIVIVVLVVTHLTACSGQGGSSRGHHGDHSQIQMKSRAPKLMNMCLITNNVGKLVKFYSVVLETRPKTLSKDYAEFHTGVGVLAIFSAEAQEKYIPHSTLPANNKGMILEFEVANADGQYERLRNVVNAEDWVKPPTTQPWGTRSFHFRDPDGNLIDFYTWVKKP
jgi:uncharacterized glyoxalase superfamily protein PhnB